MAYVNRDPSRRGKGRKVRIAPRYAGPFDLPFDPFWADEGHLDRIRYRVAE